MSDFQGNLEQFEGGVITGWAYSSDKNDSFTLNIDDIEVGNIEATIFREDVRDAGIGDGHCGFVVDMSSQYQMLVGDRTLSVICNGQKITEKEVTFKEDKNYIENPYFALNNHGELESTQVKSNYRNAIKLESFIAPQILGLSNGHYTRVSTLDYIDDGSEVKLVLNLSEIDDVEDLQFSLTAKSLNDHTLNVVFLGSDNLELHSEPLIIGQAWEEKKLSLPKVIANSKELTKIEIRWLHRGRHFFDFSKVVLAKNTDRVNLLDRPKKATPPNVYDNLISNGQFKKWNNGVDFSDLKRGMELADDWYIEYHKVNKGLISAELYLDDDRQDNVSFGNQPKYGLKLSTSTINNYARICTSFLKSKLSICDYELTLNIKSSERIVLPRIYVLGCDGKNDVVALDIVRKQVVQGNTELVFTLPSLKVEKVIQSTKGMSMLKLAIDMPQQSTFIVLGASLKNKKEDVDSSSSQIVLNRNTTQLDFEDESITEQLKIIKGIDSWLSGEVVISSNNAGSEVEPSLDVKLNDFQQNIYKLIPHKLSVPYKGFPSIDIIVPVYNACDDVLLCLSSIIEKTDLVHRVIVINDGEDERTARMLDTFNQAYNHLEVIKNDENIGYTRSVNKGINLSNADWVVVLNSDTIVSEGWLGKLMNCALSSDKAGMVGALSNAASWQSVPNIYDESGDWNLNPLPKTLTVDDMAREVARISNRAYPEVGVINGFCQLINTDMLDTIGLLDEVAFPVGYGEENDMCARAVKAGYKLFIADDTYVYHSKSKSFGHEKRKLLAKQGSIALKEKHPDVDWGAITKSIFENEDLVELRRKLNELWIK